MAQVNDCDVEVIKDWLEKEPQLPKNFDEIIIKKFLFSCNCSLEETKKCIAEFFKRRAQLNEIYTNRDPLSKSIQSALLSTNVTSYIDGNQELLIHQLWEMPSDYDFYEMLKSFTMHADNWIRQKRDVLPEHHTVILDVKQYTLKLVAKSNIFYYQKFLRFLLDSMPVRLKHVHVVNCPSFYEYMYNLIKPALPENICNLIYFHSDHTGLYKFINKTCLPKDYGGDCEPMKEQNEFWVKEICENRKMYLDDSYWKAQLSQKVKKSKNGSFKELAID